MQDRQQHLHNWIKVQHAGQERKDGEDYINHLDRVADRARDYIPLGYEIGLCHDLIEDTERTTKDLWNQLLECGYTEEEVERICKAVHHLTAVYSSDNYPWMNREERKKMEASRLMAVRNSDAITVKYCDLLDNVGAAQNLEKDFAIGYLKEKAQFVPVLNQGDPGLFELVKETLDQAIEKLAS